MRTTSSQLMPPCLIPYQRLFFQLSFADHVFDVQGTDYSNSSIKFNVVCHFPPHLSQMGSMLQGARGIWMNSPLFRPHHFPFHGNLWWLLLVRFPTVLLFGRPESLQVLQLWICGDPAYERFNRIFHDSDPRSNSAHKLLYESTNSRSKWLRDSAIFSIVNLLLLLMIRIAAIEAWNIASSKSLFPWRVSLAIATEMWIIFVGDKRW